MTKASSVSFPEMTTPTWTLDDLAAAYADVRDKFEKAPSDTARKEAVLRWDRLRREVDTGRQLANVRFKLDTRDAGVRDHHRRLQRSKPKFDELDDEMRRFFLGSEHRDQLARWFGAQPLSLWSMDITTRSPAIEDQLKRESDLTTEYTELLGGFSVEFEGDERNQSQLRPFLTSHDRTMRRRANDVLWSWYDEQKEQLDRCFSELVETRASMAQALGDESFTALGYRRMQRTDYGPDDVARFREEVLAEVVPLAVDLRRQQADTLGLDELMWWDEPVHDPSGNAQLVDTGEKWLRDTCRAMFAEMGPRFAEFWQLMEERQLLDLDTRSGKAAGAFVTDYTLFGVPFMFCNSAGVKSDIKTLTHEAGHAFQVYQSRHFSLVDNWWPTAEAAEIHSMSLEFLTWPHMTRFFGDDADAYRRQHLIESLLFLPYGVAIDHFQHEIYANVGDSPTKRHARWQAMEGKYLPWRNYGDLPFVSEGKLWMRQLHVFCWPFYYIDYTLALTCALQMWLWSRRDPGAALEGYVALCELGGSRPFLELVEAAGLRSPFEPGCLRDVVAEARSVLLEGGA